MAILKKTIDFTNVSEASGVNPKRMPAGAYVGVVVNIDDKDAKDGESMWRFDVKLKKDPTAVYPIYCKLVENQLWKLRGLLTAAGFNVPKKRIAVDPNKLVGKEVGIVLEDDEYEGKEKSVISGSPFPAAEVEGMQSAMVPADEAEEDEDLPEETEDTEVEDDEELDLDEL